ncbi:multidrug effflux MFS transporter [Rhodovibrionaceae bacterium A322]
MFRAASTPPHLFTLMFLSALSVLSLNMFLPSLANISQSFQARYELVNLSIAGYLGTTAILQLIIGPVSDRFGRRPVLLVVLVVFCLASLGCALANSVSWFLFFRMVQGVVIAGVALAPAVIRDVNPAQEAAGQIGYVNMVMAVAPMLGPLLGGGVDELFGWRSSFHLFFFMGAVAFLLCWFDLGETNQTRSRTFTTQVQSYPDLLRSRLFWGYSLCMAFSTGAFYSFLSGVPLVVEVLFHMPTSTLGAYLGSITMGFALGSFLSGRFSRLWSMSGVLLGGRSLACLALIIGLLNLAVGEISELAIFGATIFVGLSNGLTLPICLTGILSVRPDLAGSASGLSGALTVGGGAILTFLSGALVDGEKGVFFLLGMMLFCCVVALAAAIFIVWYERRTVIG